ncbi:MAG TPA: hypothetical protein PLD20_18575 [Blastocatellia bacterium]|nr:hypothetical protein [Blastocatellia bacterium]HMZ19949.1 hypothetical protein [Blastocatellia bacterium]HNG29848.1 hypothetical protein [Blastocatellia bacterium]
MNHLHRFAGIVVAACLFLTCSASQQVRRQGNSEFKIPFTLTAQNNIVVKTVLNHTDAFDLMLHTATADVRLTEDAVRKSKSIKFTDAAKVESWGGKSDSRFSLGNHLQIGALQWDGIKIWEDKNSGVGTDGKFGLDLFQGRIVEIDFDNQRITVSDRLPSKAAKYQRLKLETTNGDLFVEANCLIDGTAYSNRFLIHSGYSGGLLLDDAFVTRTSIDGKIKITEESSLKDSFGNTIQVKKAVLPALALGNLQLQNVATGFFSGSIGRQKMSVLGGDVLKRFNLIFDIANNTLYILRNSSSVSLKQ